MGLTSGFLSYIRFFVFLAPVIIPSFAILGSLYDQDIKGFLYILGLVISMGTGKWLSTQISSFVPHTCKGTGPCLDYDTGVVVQSNFIPSIDPACNLFDIEKYGWGTVKSSPGPHALFMSFTLTYLALPMFVNGNINFMVLGGLLLLTILSGTFRTAAPLLCVHWSDVVMGWGTGFILGSIWFFFLRWMNTTYTSNNLTYFGPVKSDKQMCILEKKAFRCRKSKASS